MEFCDFRELTQTPLDKGSESFSSAVWQQTCLYAQTCPKSHPVCNKNEQLQLGRIGGGELDGHGSDTHQTHPTLRDHGHHFSDPTFLAKLPHVTSNGTTVFGSTWIHIRTFSFPFPDWLPLPNSSIAKHPTCVVQWGGFAHTEGAGCGLGGRCHTKDGFR